MDDGDDDERAVMSDEVIARVLGVFDIAGGQKLCLGVKILGVWHVVYATSASTIYFDLERCFGIASYYLLPGEFKEVFCSDVAVQF